MTDWQKRNLKLTVTHPLIQDMADATRDLCKAFATQDYKSRAVLVLCGDSGSGKTHTAKAAYKWAREASGRFAVSVVYQAWPEACDLIAEGYDGLVQDCMYADFLVLDDVGAETDKYRTGKMTDKLCQILSRRERKFTIITTNVGPGQWGKRFDVRIADRLMRNTVVVDLSSVPSFAVAQFQNA